MRSGTYQSTTLLAVVLLLLILFISAGYFFLIPPPDRASEPIAMISELQRNRETWENNRPRSYRYVVRRICFCEAIIESPYVATEQQGSKVAEFPVAVESATGEFLGAPPSPVWIADIFDQLVEATEVKPSPTIEVRYDARYGYPAAVHIQYTQPDIYVGYEIEDFEVLDHR